MTESHLLRAILAAWGAHPRVRLARTNTGGATLRGRFVRFNPPGTGDITGLIAPSGRLVMIEAKSAIGQQRAAQVTMQRVITAMGGLYLVARSLADVDAAFAAEGIHR